VSPVSAVPWPVLLAAGAAVALLCAACALLGYVEGRVREREAADAERGNWRW
jgi:hypothetical protein